MGTNSIPAFTGTSQYSTDFQNVITRAVAIASMPINQLNSNKTTLQNQSTALTALDSKFAALQAAIDGIDRAVAGGSLQASLSDTKLVTASAGNGATEGAYSIEVQDIGAYASSLTAGSWVNAQNLPGQERTYQLRVGNASYDITPADNSAATVAAAINATAGAR
jgi:flagellar hook-associated protein 2